MKPGEQLALVGFSGSGKSTLAQCIGQLYKYTGGRVMIDNKEVSELTKRDIIRNIGFVPQAPFIFSGTVEDGNGSGGEDASMPSLDDIIAILQQTGIFVDVLRFGLNTILVHDQNEELVARILRVRENFQSNFGEKLSDYVEFFDENRYLFFSSVTENLTFGTSNREEFNNHNLVENEYFLNFLEDAQLTRPLLSLGTFWATFRRKRSSSSRARLEPMNWRTLNRLLSVQKR
jgi:ABC-type bacteriocin/lantibiotic exporter with double-glycine peptidase domain